MSSNSYFQHHHTLLVSLYQHCQAALPFSSDEASDVDQEVLLLLKTISEADHIDENFQLSGQNVLTRIIGNYPHITPEINRDLLWFFGGECLHYMADEELEKYQQLDELLHSDDVATVDYPQAKAKVFKLH